MPINYVYILGESASAFAMVFAITVMLLYQNYAFLILIPFGIITLYFIHKDKQKVVSNYGEN